MNNEGDKLIVLSNYIITRKLQSRSSILVWSTDVVSLITYTNRKRFFI